MKTILGIALTIIAGATFAGTSRQTARPATFEYKFEYKCDENRSNRYGAEGWELVSAVPGAGGGTFTTCMYKRPK